MEIVIDKPVIEDFGIEVSYGHGYTFCTVIADKDHSHTIRFEGEIDSRKAIRESLEDATVKRILEAVDRYDSLVNSV